MQIFIYIYNLFLIMTYTITLAVCSVYTLKEKEKSKKLFFMVLCLYLSFFILDNLIISLTELFNHFGANYNSSSQGTPLPKSIIFLVNNFCQLWLVITIRKGRLKPYQLFALVLNFIWMLIPFLPTSALRVYLYYLPNQILLFYTGLCAKYKLNTDNLSKVRRKYLNFIFYIAVIFSILILIEDTFVIFNIDQYNVLNFKIMNRNFSEDVYSFVVCLLTLHFFNKDYKFSGLNGITPSANTEQTTEQQLVEHLFFNHFNLTEREKEICSLLLKHKTNQEIADELYLSIGTVKTHVHNIYIKTDIKKRQQIFDIFQAYQEEL